MVMVLEHTQSLVKVIKVLCGYVAEVPPRASLQQYLDY